jgi:mannosyltransferase OCH1-like enzyme
MIPKIIHQTYKNADLPAEISAGTKALRDQNPDWSYSFYTDADCEEFIASHFDSTVLEAYLSINPTYGAARADLFRYLLIYHKGGVYLDIKSTANHPLSEVTKNESYLLSHWDNSTSGTHPDWGIHIPGMPNGEFQQWYIAAEQGHPFLLHVIKSVLDNIKNYTPESHGVGKLGTLKTTGPIAYTLAIISCMPFAPHRLVRNNHMLGLAYSIFEKNGKAPRHHENNMPNPHYSNSDEPIVLK